ITAFEVASAILLAESRWNKDTPVRHSRYWSRLWKLPRGSAPESPPEPLRVDPSRSRFQRKSGRPPNNNHSPRHKNSAYFSPISPPCSKIGRFRVRIFLQAS